MWEIPKGRVSGAGVAKAGPGAAALDSHKMTFVMAGLFISYRRADGGWSGRLRDHLELRFGAGVVWWDLDDIRPGQRWREEIESALKTAEAALILIGPRWLSETDAKGQKRLSKRTDVVRAEVAEALRGPAVVIPILVGGASMPEKRVLPDSIAAVTDR